MLMDLGFWCINDERHNRTKRNCFESEPERSVRGFGGLRSYSFIVREVGMKLFTRPVSSLGRVQLQPCQATFFANHFDHSAFRLPCFLLV
jgi:hypothetical protein